MNDIVGALLDVGIHAKGLAAGRSAKTICPKCCGGRTREVSLSVTADLDGGGATWLCHRGSCGWKDGVRTAPSATPWSVPLMTERKWVAPVEPKPGDCRCSELGYAAFAERGVSRATVDAFGVYTTRRRFPDPVGNSDAIVFPYRVGGRLVNRKFRPHPAKTPMLQEPNALPSLFNFDAVPGADTVVWVE